MPVQLEACPVRGTPDCHPVSWCGFHRCQSCRSAVVHPQPSQAELSAYYSRYHRPEADGGLYDTAEARSARDVGARLRLVRAAAGPGPVRLLDVGCGKGVFVRACLDAGMDSHGLDLSDTAIQYARSVLKVPAHQGDLAAVPGALGSFDVVTLWATIEHLPDPARTLQTIASVLRPGGHLLLDTGIADDWLDRMLPGTTQWYTAPEHLFVFSTPDIRRLLVRAGFLPIRMDRCFERNLARRALRIARGPCLALAFRALFELARLPKVTHFPLGNVMSITAKRLTEHRC